MAYKDNKPEYETCQLDDDEVVDEEVFQPMEISHSHETNSISNKRWICMSICFFAGLLCLGYIGGITLNNTILSSNEEPLRGPAASMTAVTAKDIAKKKDANTYSGKFDNVQDLSSLDKKLLEFLTRSSFAREQTIQLLTDKYTSDLSSNMLMSDKLDDAIEAISDIDANEEKQATSSSSIFDDVQGLSSLDMKLLEFLLQSSFAREQTVQLLIDEYISPNYTLGGWKWWYSSLSGEVLTSDLFNDTIEAMDLVVTDGLPVQIEGYPFLFVGSVGAVMNPDGLKEYGITDIVSWSSIAKCGNYDFINCMCIIDVTDHKDMAKHIDDELNDAVDYIEEVRKAGGKVMSQCWYGRNRSVTLLVAYLIKYGGFDYNEGEEVLHLIQKTRPIADSYREVVNTYGKNYAKSQMGTEGER